MYKIRALFILLCLQILTLVPSICRSNDQQPMIPADISFESITDTASIRLLLVAHRETVISSRFFSTIKKIHVKESDGFNKGNPLVTFDCSELNAQKKVALTKLKLQKITNIANLELHKEKIVGSLEKDLSAIKVEEANASVAVIDARLKNCRITSPFSGQVVELHAHDYETLQPGDPIMLIQSSDDFEIHMHVPSKWLSDIKPGTKFEAAIEETGKSYQGLVTSVGARVDSVSRTVKIYARLEGNYPELLPGMSGFAKFSTQ